MDAKDYKNSLYSGEGKIVPLAYRAQIASLTEMVSSQIRRKYGKENVLDAFERIIKELIEHDGKFECSIENIGKKIIVAHDIEDNPIASLLIGVYHEYRRTVLEKLAQRLSQLIYETGMKDEIVSAMFLIIIKEMKLRFSGRDSGYLYSGVDGIKNEGMITKR